MIRPQEKKVCQDIHFLVERLIRKLLYLCNPLYGGRVTVARQGGGAVTNARPVLNPLTISKCLSQ